MLDTDKKDIRIATFDIEATDLEAQHGYMLCACVKEVSKDNLKGVTHVVRIDDPRNKDKKSDKWVVAETIKLLNSFDLIITWYGSRYDFPFINTRALKHGLTPPVRNFRRDLCMVARGGYKLKNNRLATWGQFLFGKSGKSFLDWEVWLEAIRGSSKALSYIVDHCEKDVLETERIYKKFMPTLGKLRRG